MENPRNRYRSRLEIIRDILLVVEDEICKKTHIMYGANLSYKLLTQYLKEILNAELIEYDGESHYSITGRGKKFLKLYKEYEEKLVDLEERINHLKNGKEILKRMLSPPDKPEP